MKLFNIFTTLYFASVLLTSCSSDTPDLTEDPESPDIIEVPEAIVAPSATFPKKDNSQAPSDNPSMVVSALLLKTGPEIAKGLGDIQIKENEYQEIKEFTDNLVSGLSSANDKYKTIFDWVKTEVKYTYEVNNDPYPVFKSKQGICQGYANLLKVMLHRSSMLMWIRTMRMDWKVTVRSSTGIHLRTMCRLQLLSSNSKISASWKRIS